MTDRNTPGPAHTREATQPTRRRSRGDDWLGRRITKLRPKIKCRARNRFGKPCGNYAIHGAVVCDSHGGRAPQVWTAAFRRAADQVIATELRAMATRLMAQRRPAPGAEVEGQEVPPAVVLGLLRERLAGGSAPIPVPPRLVIELEPEVDEPPEAEPEPPFDWRGALAETEAGRLELEELGRKLSGGEVVPWSGDLAELVARPPEALSEQQIIAMLGGA
ncbi:MAG: hypothetical protein ACRDQX_01155 [Pseudonocardiaceae bacterium]